MKKHAIVIAFGLMISAACLSQQPGWKTEHHDTMVVPPNAADVTFTERDFQDELTYTVDEPYPAQKFVDDLCEQTTTERLGAQWGRWLCQDIVDKGTPPTSVKYRLLLALEKWNNDDLDWEAASYDLEYKTVEDEHHAHTLHVDTRAIIPHLLREKVPRLKSLSLFRRASTNACSALVFSSSIYWF